MTQTVALLPYDSPLFRKNKSALSYYGKIKVFGKYCILMPGLHSVGGGGIFVIKFYSTEIKVSSGTHLNTRKYIVYSIKLLTSPPPPPPSVKLFFSISYMLNSKNSKVRVQCEENTCAYYSRVKITIFFMEKISFSLKIFSDHFYGKSLIKTV